MSILDLTKGLLTAALLAVATAPAAAQDRDEIRGQRLVIELDEDGRIVVDGTPIAEDDDVVLRIRPENGELEIESIRPGDRIRLLRSGEKRARIFEGPNGRLRAHVLRRDGAPMRMREFKERIDLPDLSALEELRFSFDEPMRLSMGEDLRRRLDEHLEVAELERASRELAREVRRADAAEREELEAELREKLEEVFDKKMELRRDRIDELEHRLGNERETVRKRSEARQDIIERRFRRLLGENDVLEW